MTIDLKAIRERCAAATKGPWKWGDGQHEGGMLVTDAQPFVGREELLSSDRDRFLEYGRRRYVACGWDDGSIDFQNDADAEFVVQARSDIPALLGLVDHLTRALLDNEWYFDGFLHFVCNACNGHQDRGHMASCRVDAALTAAGLDTREKRDGARKRGA